MNGQNLLRSNLVFVLSITLRVAAFIALGAGILSSLIMPQFGVFFYTTIMSLGFPVLAVLLWMSSWWVDCNLYPLDDEEMAQLTRLAKEHHEARAMVTKAQKGNRVPTLFVLHKARKIVRKVHSCA